MRVCLVQSPVGQDGNFEINAPVNRKPVELAKSRN